MLLPFNRIYWIFISSCNSFCNNKPKNDNEDSRLTNQKNETKQIW